MDQVTHVDLEHEEEIRPATPRPTTQCMKYYPTGYYNPVQMLLHAVSYLMAANYYNNILLHKAMFM